MHSTTQSRLQIQCILLFCDIFVSTSRFFIKFFFGGGGPHLPPQRKGLVQQTRVRAETRTRAWFVVLEIIYCFCVLQCCADLSRIKLIANVAASQTCHITCGCGIQRGQTPAVNLFLRTIRRRRPAAAAAAATALLVQMEDRGICFKTGPLKESCVPSS